MFKGVYTALVTPFDRNENIDETALRDLVDFQIQQGVDGLVPVGTTGESPTVSHKENVEIVRIVIDQAAGRVPVIAGTGSNSTSEAIDMTLRAKELGASASLQVAPYYNKPNQEGFFRHFTEIADKTGLPVVIYNIPGRTSKNIEASTILELAKNPGIHAVKEASGDIAQMMNIIANKPADFDLLTGDDNITLPLMSVGAAGVVSVASNIIPGEMKQLVDLAAGGNFVEAAKLHYKYLPLFSGMFLDTNPIPVKYAYSLIHNTEPVYRLPLCAPSAEVKEKIRKLLVDYGLI